MEQLIILVKIELFCRSVFAKKSEETAHNLKGHPCPCTDNSGTPFLPAGRDKSEICVALEIQ